MNKMKILLAFTFLILVQIGFSQEDTVRLNELRFLASHNSYKRKPDPKVIRFLSRFKKRLGGDLDPIQLDYGHLPIPVQLNDYNIRGFELDVYNDPKGGHYRKRRVNMFLSGRRQKIKNETMRQPGFKILHIADVDFETNYLTIEEAFSELSQWSLTHPTHEPIFINIEAKGSSPGDYSGFLRFLGFKRAIPFDSIAVELLDQKIRKWFGTDSLLFSPKDLQGEYSSIKERLEDAGWPTLEEVRGKILFLYDSDHDGLYNLSLNNGEDKPMFAYGEIGGESTAFVMRNDPIGKEEEINELSRKYMVRTRTDAGSLEARAHDYTRYQAAMKSNAQIISTDYYEKDPEISDFQIGLVEAGKINSVPFILKTSFK
jgi:hypothetical protein